MCEQVVSTGAGCDARVEPEEEVRHRSGFEARQKRYPDSVLASARFRHKCPYLREHIEEPLDAVRTGLSARSVKLECPSGGSLIIEETAAFTAVDVNGGSARKSNGETTEEFIQLINLEARAVLPEPCGSQISAAPSSSTTSASTPTAPQLPQPPELACVAISKTSWTSTSPSSPAHNPPKTEVGDTNPVAGGARHDKAAKRIFAVARNQTQGPQRPMGLQANLECGRYDTFNFGRQHVS